MFTPKVVLDGIGPREERGVIGFDVVWQRIVALQAESFRQKTGRPFRYRISGNSLAPSTTSRLLSRSQFARAFHRLPLRDPGQLQDLQGPSCLFTILTGPRVTAAGPDSASPAGKPSAWRRIRSARTPEA